MLEGLRGIVSRHLLSSSSLAYCPPTTYCVQGSKREGWGEKGEPERERERERLRERGGGGRDKKERRRADLPDVKYNFGLWS